MIFNKTKLVTLDNSGVRLAEIIKILHSKKQQGKIGKYIIVAIKKVLPKKKIKKHEIRKAVIVQTKKKLYRKYSGFSISFIRNSCIMLDNKNNPMCTRIKGTVTHELRYLKLMKIISLAPSIL